MNMHVSSAMEAAPLGLRVVATKPTISIIGLGYVGAVSTACLAQLGHRVIGVDLDHAKRAQIAAGQTPIHEAGLGDALAQGVADGYINTTDDIAFAVRDSDVTFVSVGTPTGADGGCDDRFIRQAAKSLAVGLAQKSGYHLIVMRCSYPPGTTLNLIAPILEEVSGKTLGQDFGLAFNPEFLREGVAMADFYAPPKTVLGVSDDRAARMLSQIYAPVDTAPIVTTIPVAEMVKYVDNVWHATKVSFANEVGRFCKPLGIDSHDVMDVFVQDTKLNLSPYYLKPGFAYGGSCLPKEVRAVAHLAEEMGVSLPLIESLDRTNKTQVATATEMVKQTGARKVGILGLAFKPGTDDLRESPILEVMADLQASGCAIVAHDPAVTRDTPIESQLAYVAHAGRHLADLAPALREMLTPDLNTLLTEAEVLVVTHNDPTYRAAAAHFDGPVIDLVHLGLSNSDGIGW